MPFPFPVFEDRDVLEAAQVNAIQDAVNTLDAGKAPVVHGHVAADVTDFAETARDTLASALVAGANVTITPDDNANTITIAAAGGGSGAVATVANTASVALTLAAGELLADAIFGTTVGKVAQGNDSRFHSPVTVQDTTSINLTLADQELYAAAIFGTTATTIAAGNHTHSQLHDPVTVADTTGIDLTLTGQQISAAPIFGTTSGTVAQGNDARLSDARTPTTHVHSGADITTGQVPVARLGTGTPSGTTYLDGTGAWSTPAGGGTHFHSEYNRYIFAPTLPQLQQWTQHHPARTTATYTLAAGSAYFYALISPVDLTIDGIGVGVNTALAGTILTAVWSSEAAVLGNQRLRPRALLSGIGSIDTSTTGRKLGTFTPYLIPKNVPVFLMFRPSSAVNLLSLVPASSLYPTGDSTANNQANLLIANSPAVSTAMTEVSPAVGTSSNNTPTIEWRVTAIGT